MNNRKVRNFFEHVVSIKIIKKNIIKIDNLSETNNFEIEYYSLTMTILELV